MLTTSSEMWSSILVIHFPFYYSFILFPLLTPAVTSYPAEEILRVKDIIYVFI